MQYFSSPTPSVPFDFLEIRTLKRTELLNPIRSENPKLHSGLLGFFPFGLDALQAKEPVQRFDSDQLDCCRRSEPGPHGDKTSPETQRPVAGSQLGGTVDESRIDFLVALVHQRRSDAIEGADRAGHGETRDHCRAEGRSQILALPPGRRRDKALGNVVHAHFGCVQDTRPHDVGADATIESRNSVGSVKVTEGLAEAICFSAVGLGHRLEDVEGVAHQ